MNTRKAKTIQMFKEIYCMAWDCIEGKMLGWYAIDSMEHAINQAVCFAPWILRRRIKKFREWFDENKSSPDFNGAIYRIESALYGVLRGMGVKKTYFVNLIIYLPHGFKKTIPLTMKLQEITPKEKKTVAELQGIREGDMVENSMSDLDQITA